VSPFWIFVVHKTARGEFVFLLTSAASLSLSSVCWCVGVDQTISLGRA